MDILYIAHRIPFPPDKGDKLRAFRQLEYLARRHRVSCACFVDDPKDLRHVAVLETLCRQVAAVPLGRRRAAIRGLLGWARGSTVTESYYRVPAMHAVLRDWSKAKSFDAVVAFSSSMAPYALAVPAGRRVLDLCDLDSRKWLDYADYSGPVVRRMYHCEGLRLTRRERAWIEAFDATLLITGAEAEPLRRSGADASVHVVGNGVDVPESDPADGGSSLRSKVVGFMGTMNYLPNVDAVRWFVGQCWPAIRKAHPEALFRIVGRCPTRAVRRLASAPGVQVVGAVADAAAQVRSFQVSVAPLRIARGLQNKVLEAMAAARPVVLTTRAAAGIAAADGHEYLIADGAEDTTNHVVGLLADPAECLRLGLAGRRFVAKHHRWHDLLRCFEGIVTGATAAAPCSGSVAESATVIAS